MKVPAVCHIVAGAPGELVSFSPGAQDLVIAADAGYAKCIAAGVAPHLFVGDYDSIDVGGLQGFDGERMELVWEKDDTDTVAAMRAGLERGYSRFEVHAALGGDFGHSIANVQALAFLKDQGADGVLHGGGQDVYVLTAADGIRAFAAFPGMRVSVFALGGPARGVVERGMHWESEGLDLDPGFPLGVSNKAEGPVVEVGVHSGRVLVVMG